MGAGGASREYHNLKKARGVTNVPEKGSTLGGWDKKGSSRARSICAKS